MSTPVCKHPSRDMDSVYLCTTCLEELEAENTRLKEALTQIKDSLGLSARDAKNIAELALAVGKGESR